MADNDQPQKAMEPETDLSSEVTQSTPAVNSPAPKSRWFGNLILMGLVCVVMASAVLAGGYAWLNHWATGAGPLGQDTTVVIEPGQGLGQITDRLHEAGIIRNPERLVLWARLNGLGRNLKAGEYSFRPGTSPRGALARLQSGDVVIHQHSIPEGLTNTEVFERLAADDRLTGSLGMLPPEGSLLPETYHYQRGDSRRDIVRRMSVAMENTLDSLWENRAEGLPLASKEEALILASIVEKETGLNEERTKVAGVFINRLNKGMRLQSDPTVIFALTEGKQPMDRPLTRADWRIDHPYNTYIIKGLPPGPIANPGRKSIEAVLNPDTHGYIFFVADGSGGHAFSVTYDEHKRNIAKARAARRN